MNEKNNIKLNCDVPALWSEHKMALRNFIQKRTLDSALTDDILHEVLLKVYNFCMSKSGVGNVRSWLFQIAQNTLIDYQRKQSKLTYNIPELVSEQDDLIYREASEYILPMIGFLPPEYAEPLLLSDIEGLKQLEIAEQLGLSLTATKSRIQRARQMLKNEFVICCDYDTNKAGGLISFRVKESCEPLQKIIQEKN
jgi:RNA polymerase sigma-70 factor, ECF subfamily